MSQNVGFIFASKFSLFVCMSVCRHLSVCLVSLCVRLSHSLSLSLLLSLSLSLSLSLFLSLEHVLSHSLTLSFLSPFGSANPPSFVSVVLSLGMYETLCLSLLCRRLQIYFPTLLISIFSTHV